MKLFLFLLRASRLIVALAVLASIIGGLSTVGVLIFVRRWMVTRVDSEPLPLLVAAFAGVCLGALLSKLVSQLLLIALSRKAVARLTIRLSEDILAAPLKHLEELGPNRLHVALIQDVAAIVQGLNAIPLFFANLAIVLGCFIYLGLVSMSALVLVAGVLAAGLPVQVWLTRRARRHFGQTRAGQEGLMGQLRHLLDGLKELKVHRGRREAFLKESLQTSVDYQESQGALSQFYLALSGTWGRLLLYVLLALLLVGLPAWLHTERRVLGGYVIGVFFLMQPLSSMKQLLPQMARARTALEKVEELGLDLDTAAAKGGDTLLDPRTSFSKLELSGVTHAYRRERDEQGFTLGPLNLTFRPGELVFLGGGNGSGKTTLAKLLVGLYQPHQGEVRLDGEPVAENRLECYRQLFSVVFSEFHLFPSLAGLGSPLPEQKVREYLELLHLDHRVVVLDGVFSTTTRLSRGQQKRLALLVAYLEDRPFYVFDEWASDQDPAFKNVFYTQLLPDLKARGKAVLVITHDDRFYHLADRLLLLDGGKLRVAGASSAEASAEASASPPARGRAPANDTADPPARISG